MKDLKEEEGYRCQRLSARLWNLADKRKEEEKKQGRRDTGANGSPRVCAYLRTYKARALKKEADEYRCQRLSARLLDLAADWFRAIWPLRVFLIFFKKNSALVLSVIMHNKQQND